SVPLAVVGFALTLAQIGYAGLGFALLLVAVNARLLLHRLSRRPDDRTRRGAILWLPLRDLLVCWVWCRALLTSRVTWRGAEFEVDVHGVMHADAQGSAGP